MTQKKNQQTQQVEVSTSWNTNVAPRGPAIEGPEGKRAFDDLTLFYEDSSTKPDYAKELLALRNPEKSKSAGRYLHALLAQCFADEFGGRARWQQSPFWGDTGSSSARNLRNEVVQAFSKKAKGEAALDAVQWLLSHEKVASNQVAAMAVLRRTKGIRVKNMGLD